MLSSLSLRRSLLVVCVVVGFEFFVGCSAVVAYLVAAGWPTSLYRQVCFQIICPLLLETSAPAWPVVSAGGRSKVGHE